MSHTHMVTIDGNEAAAYVAHMTNEVIAIYPITPASNMGEWADEWSSLGVKNLWGTVPDVIEMQSEAGAAGTIHGALQAGSLATTFTASQGLLLMIPNMYKIAGELTATVLHVSARALAAQGLSIFGDHSDVMACRSTGYAMFCSASVQEVMDFALISQAATLESRVPFLHFFDGFRSSHEVNTIEKLSVETIRAMIDEDLVLAHRNRAMNPDHPVLRGTSQNPDVYFQGRETVNTYYSAVPAILQRQMDKFAGLTGRQYRLFEYVGAAGRRARHRPHGLRDRRRTGDGAAPHRPRREGRAAQGAAVPPLRPSPVGRRPAGDGEEDRRARPLQGARFRRRAPLQGRPHRPGPGRGRGPHGDHAAGHRRALRPGLQGVHPGHGGGHLPRTGQGRPQARVHRRHHRRRHPPEPGLGPGLPPRLRRGRDQLRLLRPGLGRHRLGQQELHQDHRRGDRQLRPGLLPVRLQEGRRGDHLAPALRPQAHRLALSGGRRRGELRRLSPADLRHPLRHARPGQGGRGLPAQLRLAAGPGLE